MHLSVIRRCVRVCVLHVVIYPPLQCILMFSSKVYLKKILCVLLHYSELAIIFFFFCNRRFVMA